MLMLKAFVSAMVLAALVTPALADEFWVVHAPSSTQKCSIVEEKTQSGGAPTKPAGAIASALQTRAEAEALMQQQRICGAGHDS
jgi:hypothetical protein